MFLWEVSSFQVEHTYLTLTCLLIKIEKRNKINQNVCEVWILRSYFYAKYFTKVFFLFGNKQTMRKKNIKNNCFWFVLPWLHIGYWIYDEQITKKWKNSDEEKVHLEKIDFDATGRYYCEVSTDTPIFTKESNVEQVHVIGKNIEIHSAFNWNRYLFIF